MTHQRWTWYQHQCSTQDPQSCLIYADACNSDDVITTKAPGVTFDLIDEFEWEDHRCFVFEKAQINLYELIQMSSYTGVNLETVSSVGRQLVRALDRFSQPDLSLIHADLKPENIMFTAGVTIDSTSSMFGGGGGGGAAPPPELEVRLIDFGSSCTVGNKLYKYIQSRYYRAPEVVLELPYDESIDVWSLGCVLYELYTGDPLFRTKNAAEHIYQIVNVCGKIPREMLANAPRSLFDVESGEPTDGKAAARAAKGTKGRLASLFPSAGGSSSSSSADHGCGTAFLDLLQHMLTIDPAVRPTPRELLTHHFFGGSGMGTAFAVAATAPVAAAAAADPLLATTAAAVAMPTTLPAAACAAAVATPFKASTAGVAGPVASAAAARRLQRSVSG